MENTAATASGSSNVTPPPPGDQTTGQTRQQTFSGLKTQPADPHNGLALQDKVTSSPTHSSLPLEERKVEEATRRCQYTVTERSWLRLRDAYINHGVLVRTHSAPERQMNELLSGEPVSACWLLPGIKMTLFSRPPFYVTYPGLILSADGQKVARFKTNAVSKNINIYGSYDRLPKYVTNTAQPSPSAKNHRNDFSFLLKSEEILIRNQKSIFEDNCYPDRNNERERISSGHISNDGKYISGTNKKNKKINNLEYGRPIVNNEIVIRWNNNVEPLGVMLQAPLTQKNINQACEFIQTLYNALPLQREQIANLPLVSYEPACTRIRYLGSIESLSNSLSGISFGKRINPNQLYEILNGEAFTIKHLRDSTCFFDNTQRLPDALRACFGVSSSIDFKALLIASCCRQMLEHFGCLFSDEEALILSYATALDQCLRTIDKETATHILEWFRERMKNSEVSLPTINAIFSTMLNRLGYEVPLNPSPKARIFLTIIANTSSTNHNPGQPDGLFYDWPPAILAQLIDNLYNIKQKIQLMNIPSLNEGIEPSWSLMLKEISMIIPSMVVETIKNNNDSNTGQERPLPEIMLASLPASRDIYNASSLLDQIEAFPCQGTIARQDTDQPSPADESIQLSRIPEGQAANPLMLWEKPRENPERLPSQHVSVQAAHYREQGLPQFPGTIHADNLSDLSRATIKQELDKQPSSAVISSIKSTFTASSRPWEKIHYPIWHHSPLVGLDNVPTFNELKEFHGETRFTNIKMTFQEVISTQFKTCHVSNTPDNWQCEICLICKDTPNQPATVTSLKCAHLFHQTCLESLIEHKRYMCPKCRKNIIPFGNQPSGTMTWRTTAEECLEENGLGTIEIMFNIPAGQLTAGTSTICYPGDKRYAFLPNHEQGRKALFMLKTAFERGLVLTAGHSLTRNVEHVVTLNDIPLKTRVHGGVHGYPDPGYLDRLIDTLKQREVPEPDE